MNDPLSTLPAEEERVRLVGIAYRMTGSWADAEELVQEAYVRLARHARSGGPAAAEIREPVAWLTTVTTRLAIDHLRSARVQREMYVGPWLPEPVWGDDQDPELDVLLAESVSTAMLVVLEQLSPLERAVFVLHDVFGYAHGEIAGMLKRTPAAVRKTASRARSQVQAHRPRFTPDAQQRRRAGQEFLRAASGRDLETLLTLLAPDVTLRSDGGGVVTAARKVLHGRDRVARFLGGLAATNPDVTTRLAWINESPALCIGAPDGLLRSVMVLQIADGKIAEINAVLNPEKLRGLRDQP